MRAELASVTAGFDKLPTLAGNGGKLIAVNSGATALEAVSTVATFSITDTGFSIVDNVDATKVAKFEASGISGATTRTFTFPDASITFAGQNFANVFTLAQTFRLAATQDAIVIAGRAGGTSSYTVTLTPTTLSGSQTLTLPDATGVVVLDGATQTLTNKTLTSPVISSISNSGTLTLPTSTDTLVGRATTDTLTNKSINLSSNTLATTLAQLNTAISDADLLAQGATTIYVPATAMVARLTNGPNEVITETTTNKVMLRTYDFDATVDEFVQFSVRMPKSWNEGTVTAFFLWSSAIGSGNVVWGVQGLARSDDDPLDAAFGTAVTVTDTQGSANDLMQSAVSGAITIGGTPAENDMVIFQVYRDADNGSDTLAGDARLHGVVIIYTTNAANDA